MELSKKIYQLRKLAGMTQEQLAEKLNISRQTLKMGKRNKRAGCGKCSQTFDSVPYFSGRIIIGGGKPCERRKNTNYIGRREKICIC